MGCDHLGTGRHFNENTGNYYCGACADDVEINDNESRRVIELEKKLAIAKEALTDISIRYVDTNVLMTMAREALKKISE